MADFFIGEIRLMSFQFAPKFWAQCNGQLLPINQNQALFSLLGTFYGGNGVSTFALPDLRSRTPIHFGPGYAVGQPGGEAAHALTTGEMPAHSHNMAATSATAVAGAGPHAASPAVASHAPYRSGATPQVSLAPQAVGTAGANAAHENMQPYLTINFCVALSGIFPSRV